jgi:hypothetical protein
MGLFVACQEISPLAIYQLIMSDFDTTMVWQLARDNGARTVNW